MFDQNSQNNTQTFAQDSPTISNHGDGVAPIYPDQTVPDSSIINPDHSLMSSPATPTVTPDAPVSMPSPMHTAANAPAQDQLTYEAPQPVTQDLLEIKKDALEQLSPLVDHLDQSPEEKFKTLLMMIQASDDKTMLTTAYETAQKITDEKLKAQALLDVVNEINYFTQAEKTE